VHCIKCDQLELMQAIFTDTAWVDERGENERRVKMNVRYEMLARSRGQRTDSSWCKQYYKEERIVQR